MPLDLIAVGLRVGFDIRGRVKGHVSSGRLRDKRESRTKTNVYFGLLLTSPDDPRSHISSIHLAPTTSWIRTTLRLRVSADMRV
jgi:hypothetical protein